MKYDYPKSDRAKMLYFMHKLSGFPLSVIQMLFSTEWTVHQSWITYAWHLIHWDLPFSRILVAPISSLQKNHNFLWCYLAPALSNQHQKAWSWHHLGSCLNHDRTYSHQWHCLKIQRQLLCDSSTRRIDDWDPQLQWPGKVFQNWLKHHKSEHNKLH